MIAGLIPLIVLGGIVFIIASLARRRGDGPPPGGGFSVRRLFVYLLGFAALLVGAIGLVDLLAIAFGSGGDRVGADVASPLAMTVVGLPVFALLGRWVLSTHRADPSEAGSVAWALYLNAALVLSVSLVVVHAFDAAEGLVSWQWRAEGVAGLLVWGAVWALHWRVWRRIQPVLFPFLHVWLASAIGLWVLGAAVAFFVDDVVRRFFPAPGGLVIAPDSRDMWLAATGIVIGGAVWGWHWLRHGLASTRSEGWYAYVLLLGVMVGLIATVVAAGLLVFLVLEWFLGSPGVSAADHFREVAPALGLGTVGLASWRYHRGVLGPSARRERNEIDRVYDYMVTGVALGTVAVAFAILVLAVFDALAPASVVDERVGGDVLLTAITLLVVGVPMWAMTWRRVQRLATQNHGEVGSVTRRVYLYAVFGVGAAVAFGALISLLVVVFRALFEDFVGEAMVRQVDMPVALLLTTGVSSMYHWLVYRSEREVETRGPRRAVMLVAGGDVDLDEIEERANVRVRLLKRSDGVGGDVEAIVRAIDSAVGSHLVVIVEPGGVTAIPYE